MKNTEFNTRELAENRRLLKSRPPLVYVELTQRCNCSCRMCYRSNPSFPLANREDADMDMRVYESVVQELFDSAEVVDLRGFGETTIYPELLKILEFNWRSYPEIAYKLVSNGKAVDAEIMKAMARLDLDLHISFDAAEKDLFEFLRRGNSFDAVVATIMKWNKIYSPQNPARLLATLHRFNWDKLCGIAEFAATSGCHLLSVSEIDPMTGEEWLPDEAAVAGEMGKCVEICAAAGIDVVLPVKYMDAIRLDNGWATVVIQRCTAAWNTVLIKYDGEIYSCSHRFGSMGNMTRTSFEEIWNGERFARLREGGSRSRKSGCDGCRRNALGYLGTIGSIREKTWRLIEQQQTGVRPH
jgi:radical SAM protein with 4Fe4S-binding SPASM domain